MKTVFLRTLVALAAVTALAACQNNGYKQVKDDDIIEIVEDSASQLMSDAETVSESDRLIVMSFANVDDLSMSSRFGRIIGQQYAAEVSDDGYRVVEILMSDRVTIEKMQGEFVLSRDVTTIGEMHNADAVIVGTYAMGVEHVYVTAKIVRTSDAVVLAADSFELALGPDTRRMLQE
jgi:TolB-like protein